jgi:hypothetical protein
MNQRAACPHATHGGSGTDFADRGAIDQTVGPQYLGNCFQVWGRPFRLPVASHRG